jgi:hypothetical protein
VFDKGKGAFAEGVAKDVSADNREKVSQNRDFRLSSAMVDV